jgi:hypothetical protein
MLLIEKMVKIQRDLQITFMNIVQPVEVMDNSNPDSIMRMPVVGKK